MVLSGAVIWGTDEIFNVIRNFASHQRSRVADESFRQDFGALLSNDKDDAHDQDEDLRDGAHRLPRLQVPVVLKSELLPCWKMRF